MEYKLIIVRYGEIALKSKTVRKRFENSLVDNIKNAFDAKQISHRIKREWGRIYVYTNDIGKGVNVLQKIFGITSISPAVNTDSSMDSISNLAVNIAKEELTKENTFAIRSTRTGEHKYTSQDVAVKIGNDIVKVTKAGVNLTKPDFELFIEVRDENAYIFTEKIRGTGGLPLGTQGRLLAVIDDSKSILAAWYLMRRGCKIVFVYTGKSNTEILNTFITRWHAKSDIFMVDTKKMSLYESLNKIISERKCDAVVTGHTICSNPQKVLSDIKSLKKHVKVPVLNPLIAMERDDINKKCKDIGIQI